MRNLRFGIMSFGTKFALWQAECIRKLLAAGGVQPSLLIVDRRSNAVTTPNPLRARVGNLLRADKKLWVLYERLRVERRTKAIQQVDLTDDLKSVPQLHCEVIRKGKFSEYFKAEDIAAIRACDLDFIVRFAFGIIRGEILEAARYGVWSFHHGDEERYRGGPYAFWEIYQGDPRTGVVLQRLTDRLDGGIILKKQLFETVNYSYPANRDRVLLSATQWPAEVCRDLQRGEAAYFDSAPSKTSAPVTVAPTDRQMIVFSVRILANALRRCLGRQ